MALCFSVWGIEVAEAGILISPAAKWTTFAARPTNTESTPNYYGYSGELSVGYSFGQHPDGLESLLLGKAPPHDLLFLHDLAEAVAEKLEFVNPSVGRFLSAPQ